MHSRRVVSDSTGNMKSIDTCTKVQCDEKRKRNLDSYSYSVIGKNLTSSVEAIADVDCESRVGNDADGDIKHSPVDMLSVVLDDHCAIELTMSMEGHGDSTDTSAGNQPKDFKNGTREYCCDCHCTRNFQQRDQTTIQSNSGNSDIENNLRQQLQHHSIGVENDIKLVAHRTRLKLSRKFLASSELVNIHSDRRHSEESKIKLRSERLNSNMALILGYSITFVVLLCLCGVVFMMNHSVDSKYMVDSTNSSSLPYAASNTSKQYIETTTEPRIIKDLPYRSVSKDEFENHLARSNSSGDLLKIFFSDQSLTPKQVNSIMHMKSYYVTSDKKDSVDQTVDYADPDEVLQRNPVSDDNIVERELALQHNKEVSNHPFSSCSDPQPELVPVELPSDTAVRYIYPKCTLLHRCRNTSGCCPKGSVCAPRSKDGIELVDRYFLVLEDAPGSGGVRPSKEVVEGKTFVNHTACECKPLKIETNCRKECPRQFIKKRPGMNCQCVCRSHLRHCRQVIRGLAPLEEEGLACIKDHKCIVPQCLSGEFMITTGYCPTGRRHGHHGPRGGGHRNRRG